MKKIMIIIMIFTATLLVGCTNMNPSYDDSLINATITLERSGAFTMPEYAINKVTINSEGLLHETFFYNGTKTGSAYTKFNSTQYEDLLKVLSNADFFKLKNNYTSSIQVTDVGQGVITVETSNREKSILVNPYITEGNPSKIGDIIDELNELINDANSPYNLPQRLIYQGLQCEDEPWEVWYGDGSINFIKAPTNKELIFAYYSSKGIEIKEIEEYENEVVCDACSVCPDHFYYEALIESKYRDLMIEEGWE